jgi:hypothetical protein
LALNAATTLGEERLRDLATGIIQRLPHTPVTALGINSTAVYQVATEALWHRVGDLLAPKTEVWEKVMEGRPGMAMLRVEDLRPGPPPVRIWATVEPVREPHPPYRFQIHINWHGELTPEASGAVAATEMATRFINSEWDKVLDFGAKLADRIFEALNTPTS